MILRRAIWICFLLTGLSTVGIFAQATKPAEPEITDDPLQLFKYRNYRAAIPGFEAELKKSEKNPEILEKLGLCYMRGSISYPKAVDFFSQAKEVDKENPEHIYHLANAYQLNYQFDEAIEHYGKYIVKVKQQKKENESELVKKGSRGIETSKNAKELIKFPVDISFENMGKEINSAHAELDPFITPSKTTLIYSSNRPDGNQCAQPRKSGFTTDLYISIFKNGKWTKSSNMGNIVNTPLNERICSMNEDASSLFLYIDNEESSKDGDIYLASAKNKIFDTPFSLKGLVNTGDEESSASITSDGSALYFSSDRPGGAGKKDLFVAKKLPDQTWGEPKRLTDKINTTLNEDFPLIMDNDRTLYFCSEGHNSMGGYDIFRSEWVDSLNNWSEPVNLGYPVNTPEDNYSISFTSRSNEGYMAAIRPEGMGDYDIYRIVFNQSNGAPFSVLKGSIGGPENGGVSKDVKMIITSKKTKTLFGKYNISARKNGKYCLVLFPGDYTVEISSDNCMPHTEDITVIDKNTRGEIIPKDFQLKSSTQPETPKEKTSKKSEKASVKKP